MKHKERRDEGFDLCMRFDGKLGKWNDDRGFGFIVPSRGGDPVFVHVSAFPRDGQRSKIGEVLTFEVGPAGDGKRRAVNIQRPEPARRAAPSRAEPDDRRRGGVGWLGRLLPVAIVVGAVAAYTSMSGRPHAPAALKIASPRFRRLLRLRRAPAAFVATVARIARR